MSISTSKPILTAEAVNLVLHADIHRPWTWREAFTRATTDPVGVLLGEKDRLHIVNNVALTIQPGERVGLIGVNGSGKTSFCRCVAGMYKPTSGKITVNGKTRAIFDTSIGIQPELTGRENAELLARIMYPGERDYRELAMEALEFSELGKFINVPFKLYSKGMQARLCLSLVSARPCDLLVLDEVFDGADQFFSRKVSERVLAMIRSSGGVIFVSHSPDQIRTVCSRILVMNQGAIVFDGAVEDGIALYERLGTQGMAGARPVTF